MTAYLFYTKGTPGEDEMTKLGDQLDKRQVQVDLVEADSPRGIDVTGIYDIMARPAVVLASGDGVQVQQWQERMPTAGEISDWIMR
jgi:hypothetical protein